MRIAREEIFGPVLTVLPFEDEAEALHIANDTPYGLAAYIWTATPVGRCAWRTPSRPAWSGSTRRTTVICPRHSAA